MIAATVARPAPRARALSKRPENRRFVHDSKSGEAVGFGEAESSRVTGSLLVHRKRNLRRPARSEGPYRSQDTCAETISSRPHTHPFSSVARRRPNLTSAERLDSVLLDF